MTDFLIADLHIQHARILEFGRSCMASNVDEHDEVLIKNWNSVVKSTDTVFVLGDVCFQGVENVLKLKRCYGKKILIGGNHDVKKLLSPEFSEVFDRIEAVYEYRKNKWLLSHYPVHPYIIDNERYTANIHGHMHQGFIRSSVVQNQLEDHRYMSVSADRINFTPISVKDVEANLKERWRQTGKLLFPPYEPIDYNAM